MLNNQKGFTLIEMIITLVIIVIVFSLITPLFVIGISFFRDSNGMVMDQANLRKTMVDMSKEIRDAATVNVISSTKVEVGNCVYEFLEDSGEITKYFTDTATTIVVSRRVAFFEVTMTDNIIEFRIRAEGANSNIVTTISLRENKSSEQVPIG